MLTGHTSAVHSVALDGAEQLAVAGSAGGALKLWDLEQGKAIRTLMGHRGLIHHVEFHPFGDFFASSSADGSIRIWDIKRKGCILSIPDEPAQATQFSPDGKWLLTCGDQDPSARLWDLTAGKLLHRFAHSEPVVQVLFHPREVVMATVGVRGAVTAWDMESFGMIARGQLPQLMHPGMDVPCATFTPDGKHLVVARNNDLFAVDWEQGELVRNTQMQRTAPARDVYMTEAGSLISVGTMQSFVHVVRTDLRGLCAKGFPSTSAHAKTAAGVDTLATSQTYSMTSGPTPTQSRLVLTRSFSSLEPLPPISPPSSAPSEGHSTPLAQLHKPQGQIESVGASLEDLQFPQKRPCVDTRSSRIEDVMQLDVSPADPVHRIQQKPSNRPISSLGPAESSPLPPISPANSTTALLAKDLAKISLDAKKVEPQDADAQNVADALTQTSAGPTPESSMNLAPLKTGISVQAAELRSATTQVTPTLAQQPPLQPPPQKAPSTSTTHAAEDSSSPLVSSCGTIALNLDLSCFAQGQMRRLREPLTSDPGSFSGQHPAIVAVLSQRLQNLRAVKARWRPPESPKAALQFAASIGSHPLYIDLLRALLLQPKQVSLDIGVIVLPWIAELLFEPYEDYLMTACSAVKMLTTHFAQLIVDTLNAFPVAGLDIAREERREKCVKCRSELLQIKQVLQELSSSPGRSGALIRETLSTFPTKLFS